MTDESPDIHDQALRLSLALRRLRGRMRDQSGEGFAGLSLMQVSILQRLHADGPATASSLALAERVSQQAIAQSVAGLRARGLVDTRPDPSDGRKALIAETDAGRAMHEEVRSSRASWLARSLDATVAPSECDEVERVIELLGRLADADV